ncbi:hypothetical protein HPB50_023272 [Hyalomma asiaticum]|uniref:Uncharacterized protein n=1 Tax=Hyalomma asiaticum TaxID=266040 RepID=A0ACB7S4U0_HYAAI|nr:hypothetical protein HPB50_023272 [Hyalomma asiaticum]
MNFADVHNLRMKASKNIYGPYRSFATTRTLRGKSDFGSQAIASAFSGLFSGAYITTTAPARIRSRAVLCVAKSVQRKKDSDGRTKGSGPIQPPQHGSLGHFPVNDPGTWRTHTGRLHPRLF